MSRILLKSHQAGSVLAGHPWVYAGFIDRIEGEPADGDQVEVFGGKDRQFIGYGLYNSKSNIRVRIYSWDHSQPINDDLLTQRIQESIEFRREFLGSENPKSAQRLIFSEADRLSGLIVDQYGSHLAVQITSLALSLHLPLITKALSTFTKPQSILLKIPSAMAEKEGMMSVEQTLEGELPIEPLLIEDRGIQFEVDLRGGQKTGFFLDQRENRHAAGALAKGRSVLDLYCYTGGFALHCAAAGAKQVTCVDSSKKAIDQGIRNSGLNSFSNIGFLEFDTLEYLQNQEAGQFSMVILDPPKFATSKDSKERALKMYYRVNTEALRVVNRGGIYVSSSCSGRITTQDFVALLGSVAMRSGRHFQILEVRGASRDHPVVPHIPETHYLKCVIARVT